MTVHTKQINETWHCTTTFKGYDYGSKGKSIKEAQGKILSHLEAIGVEFKDIKWTEPKYDVRYKSKVKPYKWTPPKIDNL